MIRSRISSFVRRCAQHGTNRLQHYSTGGGESPPLSYYHHIGDQPLVHRTVGQQLERAARLYGDREAVVACAQHQRLTYAQVLDQADRMAAGFVRLGMQRGDRVGIWSPNSCEWYVSMMAAARAGLVTVALNPAYQAPEIGYCLKKVGMRAIYAADVHKERSFYEVLRQVVPEIGDAVDGRVQSDEYGNLKTVVIGTDKDLPGAYTFNDLLHLATAAEARAIGDAQSQISADDPCNIQFTSGTTGQPKAAVLSHHNFVNNGIHIGQRSEMAERPHRVCVQVPLFHAFGVVIAVMASLAHGSTLVLPAAGYSPEASLRAIERERCTYIYGTPTMYVDLVAKQRELQLDVSSAEVATTGGAPCSPQLFREIKSVLQLRCVKTVFGLTETSGSTFFSMAGETETQVTETVGHLQNHLEAKVVDEQGVTVPMGEPGELLVRGYSTFLGYYGDETKTRETIAEDRWLRTGDQFVLMPNGYGKIVGRLKDVIIRGGENIYPKEVEDFLNTMPAVLECHVYGVPDERLGEEVAVAVRLEPTTTKPEAASAAFTRDTIVEFCRGKLSPYKVPKYVQVVEAFPKTASGKVQKFKLREQFVAAAQCSRTEGAATVQRHLNSSG